MKKAVLKLMTVMGFAAALAVVFSVNASAYIDPSVVTYLIQAGAAVVVAIGAVVGVLWRRAKKKAQKVLNIDENKNKEVESDEIIDNSEN